MIPAFFQYFLECVNCDGFSFTKQQEQSQSTMQSQVQIKVKLPAEIRYIQIKDLPLGQVPQNEALRYKGTSILVKIVSLAGYPFPAKIDSVTDFGQTISVSWVDLYQRKLHAILEPFDELKIELVKDRSPITAALRESEKRLAIQAQLDESNKERERRHGHNKVSIRKLANEMSRMGISCSVNKESGTLSMCDGTYLVDYSQDSEEFEITNHEGEFISKFSSDEVGFKRLLKKVKKLEETYDPEQHAERIMGAPRLVRNFLDD